MAIRKYWENKSAGAWYPGDPPERLTAEGEAYFLQHGQLPPDDARADAESVGSGLRMTEKVDGSGRPIRTFENTGNRKVWMRDFMSPAYQMLKICKTPQTEARRQAFEQDWREVEQMRATGVITSLPEIG